MRRQPRAGWLVCGPPPGYPPIGSAAGREIARSSATPAPEPEPESYDAQCSRKPAEPPPEFATHSRWSPHHFVAASNPPATLLAPRGSQSVGFSHSPPTADRKARPGGKPRQIGAGAPTLVRHRAARPAFVPIHAMPRATLGLPGSSTARGCKASAHVDWPRIPRIRSSPEDPTARPPPRIAVHPPRMPHRGPQCTG